MPNTKQDLTEYSDQELSLHVFNDECLYKMRRNFSALKEFMDEYFIYSEEQLEILKQDIEEDLAEEG